MKRRLAMILTMALLLFTLPVSSLATEAEPGQDMPAVQMAQEETAPTRETTAASGICGDNPTWTLDSAGTHLRYRGYDRLQL